MYGNEKEVGEAVRALGHPARRGLRDQQAEQRLPPPRRRPARLRPDAGRPRLRDPRPVPRALAAADHRRRLRRDVEGDGGDLRAAAACRAIGVSNFNAAPPAPAVRRDRDPARRSTRSRSTPTSRRTTLRAFDAEHEIVTEAWSPIAQGKVLDDPAILRVAERLREDAGAGRAPLARAARRRRLPQVGDPQPHGGELRALRLRARRGRDGRHHRRWTAASAPAPTRTRSTTSPGSPARSRGVPESGTASDSCSVRRDEVDELLDPADQLPARGRSRLRHAGEDALRPHVAGVVLPAQPAADAGLPVLALRARSATP